MVMRKSLDRCYILDETLSRLARVYPDTKFIHARAASLGFASKSPAQRKPAPAQRIQRHRLIDDDDPYGEDDAEEKNGSADDNEDLADNVDTEMLPTMLVYRDGELVHNWVRVDWEAGRASIEELLIK